MLAKIPREFLWADLNTMEDFFWIDPVNRDFLKVFEKLNEEPFGVKLDAVKVFNEVYYQTTKFLFEHPTIFDYHEYSFEIQENLGSIDSAELVLTMSYWLTEIKREPKAGVFKAYIYSVLQGCDYWKPFHECYDQLLKSRERVTYDFKPRPMSPRLIRKKSINWRDVTINYDLVTIGYILDLWDKIEDRKDVAAMIKESMDSPENIKNKNLQEETLQDRLNELEAENKRLNTLLEEMRQNNKAQDTVDEEPNFFQAGRFLKGVLNGNWFEKVRTQQRYTSKWREAFVDALLKSDYGWDIAKAWENKDKREPLKAYIVGCLKDTGVISGAYDVIAKLMEYDEESYRTFSRYLGRGKNQDFFEWIKDYVEKSKLGQ